MRRLLVDEIGGGNSQPPEGAAKKMKEPAAKTAKEPAAKTTKEAGATSKQPTAPAAKKRRSAAADAAQEQAEDAVGSVKKRGRPKGEGNNPSLKRLRSTPSSTDHPFELFAD